MGVLQGDGNIPVDGCIVRKEYLSVGCIVYKHGNFNVSHKKRVICGRDICTVL